MEKDLTDFSHRLSKISLPVVSVGVSPFHDMLIHVLSTSESLMMQ